MSTRHCEECWAALDAAKVLRCTKCKMVFYCSKGCQSRNWKKIHKRVCTADPSLQPFVPVEMAFERTFVRQPKIQAPKDATCYICLEGDGESSLSKLMRGCACRGDSAGFVHVECLTKLAMSQEASGNFEAAFLSWVKCGNCKQTFQGALNIEMTRRLWRVGILDVKFCRAKILSQTGRKLEALDLLQAILPEAKHHVPFYVAAMKAMTDVLGGLGRFQECFDTAAEILAFTEANYRQEDVEAMEAKELYAKACANVGRMEEAMATLENLLTTETRIFGRDHPHTQQTRRCMHHYGFFTL